MIHGAQPMDDSCANSPQRWKTWWAWTRREPRKLAQQPASSLSALARLPNWTSGWENMFKRDECMLARTLFPLKLEILRSPLILRLYATCSYCTHAPCLLSRVLCVSGHARLWELPKRAHGHATCVKVRTRSGARFTNVTTIVFHSWSTIPWSFRETTLKSDSSKTLLS